MLDQKWRLWGGNLVTRDIDYLAALLLVNIKKSKNDKREAKVISTIILKLTNWAPDLSPIETARFLQSRRVLKTDPQQLCVFEIRARAILLLTWRNSKFVTLCKRIWSKQFLKKKSREILRKK